MQIVDAQIHLWGTRLAEQPLASAGDRFHPRGGHRPDGRRRRRCRRHSSAGLGPEFDRHGVRGGSELPRPVRDHGRGAARSAGFPRTHRGLARTAGNARPAVRVPRRSRAAMAARRHARLALGGRREGRRPDRHAGDGFADGTRPDRRASPRTSPDDRSPGRQRRHEHIERRRGDDAYAGASGIGEVPQCRGQGDRRASLFQRGLSVSGAAHLSAAGLRCVWPQPHVLGHRHHEDALFLEPMRDDVHRGTAVAQ